MLTLSSCTLSLVHHTSNSAEFLLLTVGSLIERFLPSAPWHVRLSGASLCCYRSGTATRIDVCLLPNVPSLDNTASNQQSEVLCGALQRAHARESRMKRGGGLCRPLCGHKSQGSKPGNPCAASCESATLQRGPRHWLRRARDAQVRQRIHRTILQGQHVKKARRGSAGRGPVDQHDRHVQVPGNRVRGTRGRHMRQRHALYAGGLAAKAMTKLRRATAPTRLAGRVGKATAKRPHHAREHGTGSTAYGASSAGVSGHVPALCCIAKFQQIGSALLWLPLGLPSVTSSM